MPKLTALLIAWLAMAFVATFSPVHIQAIQASELLVSSFITDSVLRYDGQNGTFIGTFASGIELDGPTGMAFGPDDNLYVVSSPNHNVLRYDGQTGAFIDTFIVSGSGGLINPLGLVFGPDGNLYVTNNVPASFDDTILRYNGQTGAFIDIFASGGGSGRTGLVFGPDGDLYACSFDNHIILRYNGQTGAFIGDFVPSGDGGLFRPRDLTFGPDGNLYVSSTRSAALVSDSILRYNGQTGVFIDDFVPTGIGGLRDPRGLVFGPDGNLYVASNAQDGKGSVLRYNGQTGAVIDEFVSSASGGLNNAGYLLFTPVCGNQVVEAGEECDDGNIEDGDGCSETCTLEIPLPKDLLRCQQSIGRAGKTFLQKVLTAHQNCLKRQLKGKLTLDVDCRATPTGDVKTDNKLTKAENKLNTDLDKACEGVVLGALGFAGQCPDPDGSPFTLDNLQQCIQETHMEKATELINIEFPLP